MVSSTGDFGFESKTLSQAYPEADTKWAVNSIEVCLSGSGHPACRTLPPRGRPHSWRPGTHGDKSERLEASASGQPLAVCDELSSRIKHRSRSASERLAVVHLNERRKAGMIALRYMRLSSAFVSAPAKPLR